MSLPWLLIPVKDLVLAKQRLAGLLSVSERRALFQAMVEDVLEQVIRVEGLGRILLASDDPAAHLLAEHFSVDCVTEQSLGVRGLNPVVQAVAAQAEAAGVNTLVVLHADVPGASAEALTRVLSHHTSAGDGTVTVATDRRGRGSNCLLCSPPGALRFSYGENSAGQHLDQAQEQGLTAQRLLVHELAMDIDTAEDLSALLEASDIPAARTRAYLRATGVDSRLQLALQHAAAQDETGEQHVSS